MPVRVLRLEETRERLQEVLEGEFQKFSLSLFQAMNSIWPVDTGFSRVNINVSFGSPDESVQGTRPPSTGSAQFGDADGSMIETWSVGSGSIYISNGVEYSEFLDQGTSPQAPQGIVQPSIAVAEGEFQPDTIRIV